MHYPKFTIGFFVFDKENKVDNCLKEAFKYQSQRSVWGSVGYGAVPLYRIYCSNNYI